MNKPPILVTNALPYANGHLHLGHMVEHIQTNIWVRAQRLLGRECISICGEDAHGTPIMLKAEQLGITPEALTDSMRISHEADFEAFGIEYDAYHTTHSPENQALASMIYERLHARGDIIKKTIEQSFDIEKNMFLPDRYVKGTCPRCKATDQYGDNCEACGATYSPQDLIDPISAISGTTPVLKTSEHYFFDLPRYEALLRTWMDCEHLQPEVVNKLKEWFDAGLKPWDISRDAPYFGFLIPGTSDKYFYVWMDAPVGYMAAFQKYCDMHGITFDAYWGAEAPSELYHFVGKDIVYFHALFWPAMLAGSNLRLPTAIFAHGFLTINGQKMSKSRGTFIEARQYRAHLNPEHLRYYFAAKMNGTLEDIDIHFDDFLARINADLVGKVVNIASRSAGFIHKYFEGRLSPTLHDLKLYEGILSARTEIIASYLSRDYARAVRLIMACADEVNQYIDHHKPWALAKSSEHLETVGLVCTQGINLFRLLMAWLKPILPDMATRAEIFLQAPCTLWSALDTPLLDHTIASFEPLTLRVQAEHIEAMLQNA